LKVLFLDTLLHVMCQWLTTGKCKQHKNFSQPRPTTGHDYAGLLLKQAKIPSPDRPDPTSGRLGEQHGQERIVRTLSADVQRARDKDAR